MVKATRQVLAANHTDGSMNRLLGLALVLLDPTEAYEYFIITAVPAGITILFTPIWNDNVPQVVLIGEPALASTKLAVSWAMLIAQAVNLAIRCYDESLYSLQTMFAAVLSFFASLSVVWFLQFSKRYAFPSITFHNIFLTTTLLYDLAMMRHTEKSLGSIGFFQLVTVTLKLFYVLLNLSFKNPILVLQPTLLEGRAADVPSLPSIWSCLSWPGLVSVAGNLENCDLKNLPEPSWKLCSEAIFRQFKVQWNSVSIRAILIAAIYDKMMRVSAMDIQSSTALSQLMDGMRSIEILIVSTQDVASAVFQVLLGICFLWSFIGNASLLIFVPITPFQYGMTMIFGPVACGKSAVLRLILGEFTPSSGRLTVSSGPMVYCAQHVWLPFVCIQNGIVGDAVFDEEWYALVIRACGLEHEFEQLPDDDMTVIDGPRGRLSVSMKQRISLARAVYNRPTTIVLDDPLNAVQYNMASQIYENLFGDRGLVFNWECTVIMATNDFGHLQFADALFTVGYDGRMKSQIATTYRSAANIRAMLHDSNGLFNFPPTLEEAPESPLHPQPEEPDERDKIATHDQDASLSSYFQQPAGKKTIRTWYISVAATVIMEKMLEIFWSLSLSDSVLSPAYVAGYAAFGVASVLCNRMAAHLYLTRISTKSSIELHWRLIKTVMVATPEFVSNANIVSLLKLFDEDLETISRRLPITLMQRSFTLMGVTVRCSETVAGIEHIRAFKQQYAFYQDFHGALTLSQKSYYYVLEAKRQLEYTIAIFTTAVGLATMSLAFIYPQSSSPARLGLALLSIVELPEKLNSIATIWSKLDESLGAVLRIRRFCCETPIEVDEEEEPLPSKWPSKGAFEFFRVATENYGVNIDEASTRMPLVDASLEGTQKIVVSSRTGSRQPSLILAALRMINYSGAIRLDDMNIKNIPRVVLRSSMTTITREGLELEGTLRCNLDPLSMLEPYFSDADLISMLHRVKLWDAVQRRGGLDTSMKRMRFSKAQKQLLSLARGALHRRREDTKVVLIDDAITHLDGHTSKNVYDFIDGEFATCTVLMVAYDLEAIRTADTVITVEGGAITGVLERVDSE
ncbi:hypothetical protein MY3957_001100 [Beauveria namnaoensis]